MEKHITSEEWENGNAESKIIPWLQPQELEHSFSRAWEDAHLPKWRHPADAMRVFIASTLSAQQQKFREEIKKAGLAKIPKPDYPEVITPLEKEKAEAERNGWNKAVFHIDRALSQLDQSQ